MFGRKFSKKSQLQETIRYKINKKSAESRIQKLKYKAAEYSEI